MDHHLLASGLEVGLVNRQLHHERVPDRQADPAKVVRAAPTQSRSGLSVSSARATQPIGCECSRASTNSVRPEQGGPTVRRKVARPSVSSTSATPTGPPTSRSNSSPSSADRKSTRLNSSHL